MKKSRYTEEQIVGILKESEARMGPRRMPERTLVPDVGRCRETIEDWRLDYNQVRPHSSLGSRTPEEFRYAMGHADVKSKEPFPHPHSPDYGCGITQQLN